MKQEEKLCVLLGIGAALVIFAVMFWYISLPILGIFLYLRYRKKHPKKIKKGKSVKEQLAEACAAQKEAKRVIAKTRYKPRTCSYCNSEVEYLSTVNCPYCGGSLS